MARINILLLLSTLFFEYAHSQHQDSMLFKSEVPVTAALHSQVHSPHKAALFSAVIPGSGQVYNKKYWKVPIIYGGLALLGSQWLSNQNKYGEARDAFVKLLDTSIVIKEPYNGSTNVNVVGSIKNNYRNQRDMFLILTLVLYSLNIVDAAVDAHLFKFDVSDDLSMNWQMELKNYPTTPHVPSLSFDLAFGQKRKTRLQY